MKIIDKILAPISIGKANAMFIKRNYNKASALYEKALKLDPLFDQNETILSCLGRCYLGLSDKKLSLKYLSLSYMLYKKKEVIVGEFEQKEYINTLKAYANALHMNEKYGYVDDIVMEVEEKSKEWGIKE